MNMLRSTPNNFVHLRKKQFFGRSLSRVVVISEERLSEVESWQITKNFKLLCSGRFRFTILFAVFPACFIILPFVAPTYITFIINAFFSLEFLVFLILAIVTEIRMQRKGLFKEKSKDKPFENVLNQPHKIVHILMTCIYKEPFEFVKDLLEELTNFASNDSSNILLVCLEEHTPRKEEVKKIIYDEFRMNYSKVVITIHPANIPGEIPGKCSNINYGLRHLYKQLALEINFNANNYIVTNFDIDTKFHPNYFKALTNAVLEEDDPNEVVFQPILYYNWNLDHCSFITRMTGLMRNVMMMGALIPLNINVMSIYSATLKVYIEGKFTHPAYQMEDIICYIRWMINRRENMKIKPILLPVLSGPTSGDTYLTDVIEWARQLKRWSIGSAEVFHFFCVKLKRLSLCSALIWGFVYLNYYMGFLCINGVLMLASCIMNIVVYIIGIEIVSCKELNGNYFLILLGIFYFEIMVMMLINYYSAKKLIVFKIKEKIPLWKQMWLLFSSFFFVIIFSCVVYYGFLEAAFRGEKVCKHDASKKDALPSKMNPVPLKNYSKKRSKSMEIIYESEYSTRTKVKRQTKQQPSKTKNLFKKLNLFDKANDSLEIDFDKNDEISGKKYKFHKSSSFNEKLQYGTNINNQINKENEIPSCDSIPTEMKTSILFFDKNVNINPTN